MNNLYKFFEPFFEDKKSKKPNKPKKLNKTKKKTKKPSKKKYSNRKPLNSLPARYSFYM